MKKPTPIMVPLLNLDDCLTYAIRQKVISRSVANSIVSYAKCLGIQAGYWDMHWGDIEEENGLSKKEAKAYESFYRLFKKHEIDKKGEFPHLHFDVRVFS